MRKTETNSVCLEIHITFGLFGEARFSLSAGKPGSMNQTPQKPPQHTPAPTGKTLWFGKSNSACIDMIEFLCVSFHYSFPDQQCEYPFAFASVGAWRETGSLIGGQVVKILFHMLIAGMGTFPKIGAELLQQLKTRSWRDKSIKASCRWDEN